MKGLDLLKDEKRQLNLHFNDEKDNIVVAINIMMYLVRKEIIELDTALHKGKKFMWNTRQVDFLINSVLPPLTDKLIKNQKKQVGTIKYNFDDLYLIK